MRMIEWSEKAGLWWDRAGKAEKRLEELICTLSQCRDLRIWSALEDLGAATTARARVFRMCWRLF